MSAQPVEPGEEYARVPVERLRHLEAIERHAPAEVIAGAEAEEAAAASGEAPSGPGALFREIAATADPAKTERILAHLNAQRARLPEAYR